LEALECNGDFSPIEYLLGCCRGSCKIKILQKLVIFVGILSSAATAQRSITVRIADYKAAKPIANLRVEIESFNGDFSEAKAANATILAKVFANTDKHGLVVANVPEPTPEHMRVTSLDLWDSTVDFSPADALKSGAVMQYAHATDAEKVKRSPTPGEVVIYAKRIHWWNRLLLETP
jgi:hypothetical protein